jgi:hypothetical protein
MNKPLSISEFVHAGPPSATVDPVRIELGFLSSRIRVDRSCSHAFLLCGSVDCCTLTPDAISCSQSIRKSPFFSSHPLLVLWRLPVVVCLQLKRQLTDHPVHGSDPLESDGVTLTELRQALQTSQATIAQYQAEAAAAKVRLL